MMKNYVWESGSATQMLRWLEQWEATGQVATWDGEFAVTGQVSWQGEIKRHSRLTDRKLRLFGLSLWAEWSRINNSKLLEDLAANVAWADSPDKTKKGWNLQILGPLEFASQSIQDYSISQRDEAFWASGHDYGRVPAATSAILLRDIIGDPFEELHWMTTSVGGAASVAKDIYARGAFGELGVLADACEDAGCEDAGLLGHLRGERPHAHGCWALDLILGKS